MGLNMINNKIKRIIISVLAGVFTIPVLALIFWFMQNYILLFIYVFISIVIGIGVYFSILSD